MGFLRSLVAICAVLTIFLGLLPSLSNLWLFAFVGGMRMHITVAALILSLALFGLVKNRWSLLPLAASVLLAIWVGALHYGVVQPQLKQDQRYTTLKLIEFNMLGHNRNGDAIAQWLEDQDGDVVYALESSPIWAHLDELSEAYPYCAGCSGDVQRGDLIVLSKHPLEDVGIFSLGKMSPNRFIRTRITFGGGHVFLVAMHLVKPYFDAEQQIELTRAAHILKDAEGPMILGGDFNSSLLSPTVQAFMQEVGLRSHAREPRTWPVSAPSIGLPIDHILVRPPAHITALSRMKDSIGSNHFGLIADISIPVVPVDEAR
ncbi:endonuclease/exonuclease/phosphatase family protein [Martelella radicis]|uniref:Endonuclease/exonuclease/phosphatase (EEP) superfamily protein YafD n=1 Tax=Martelella radicis TaxID=1397476 RepID=A0A7W6KMW3_9HYPH|nr:endonuclease/exonuclease/phosphatase family protein [Martelella radicis]MBB4122708.1 endonuclease/exonuclease/phosphatase (EEP) superfamily protein YafD [Martelella radicis]